MKLGMAKLNEFLSKLVDEIPVDTVSHDHGMQYITYTVPKEYKLAGGG